MAKQILAYGLFIMYHVALSSIHHIHPDHRLAKRFEENLYLGAEARNICRILRIQYFCDINIKRVDPKVLNELIWFENPAIRPQQVESPFLDYESAIEDQYIYLRHLFNSTNFLWYEWSFQLQTWSANKSYNRRYNRGFNYVCGKSICKFSTKIYKCIYPNNCYSIIV